MCKRARVIQNGVQESNAHQEKQASGISLNTGEEAKLNLTVEVASLAFINHLANTFQFRSTGLEGLLPRGGSEILRSGVIDVSYRNDLRLVFRLMQDPCIPERTIKDKAAKLFGLLTNQVCI